MFYAISKKGIWKISEKNKITKKEFDYFNTVF
ncbi:hypothetical protein MSSD1_723 [Mycoplasmopsis synoviae]